MGVNTYDANQAYLLLPRSLLEMFTKIQLLPTTVGTDFSTLGDNSLYTSTNIYPDGSDAHPVAITTTPIDISSINYNNFIAFKNLKEYKFKNVIVKLSN